MTSNLGSQLFQNVQTSRRDVSTLENKQIEEKRTEKIAQEVKKYFRPEFINRLDSIIIFNPLSQEMIKEIVNLQLEEVKKRFAKQNLGLEVKDAVRTYLQGTGFDEVYGARPLKRVINEQIVDEIALQIIEGKIKPLDKILVDYKNKGVIISIKKPS